MTAKKYANIVSSLNSFLKKKGGGEMEARAVKEVIAWRIGKAMREQAISKARMAVMVKIRRALLDRLLDPERDVTLSTSANAASIVGRQIRLELT